MEPDPEPQMGHDSPPISAQNGGGLPPVGGLRRFLSAITPPWAPALQFTLWGGRGFGFEYYPLPVTQPSVPRHDWLRSELAALDFKGVPIKSTDIEPLVEMLAPGLTRADGLPGYTPGSWWTPSEPMNAKGHHTLARYIAAAVAADLGAYEHATISDRILGLSDHKKGRPRKAQEFHNYGRQLLATLGVWPWAHSAAKQRRLVKSWRSPESYVLPLMWWFNTSARELEMIAEGCRTAWASGPDLIDLDRPHRPPTLSQEPFPSELREAEASWEPLDRLMEADEMRRRLREDSRRERRPWEPPPTRANEDADSP